MDGGDTEPGNSSSPPLPPNALEQLVEGLGFVWGRKLDIPWRVWILFLIHIPVERERVEKREEGRGRQAMEVTHSQTRQSPTLLGLLQGPGAGRVQVCGC